MNIAGKDVMFEWVIGNKKRRKKMKETKVKLVFILAFFMLIMPIAYAWKWETHEYLAEQVCEQIDWCIVDCMKNGSVAPDRDFKDFINHHVYRDCIKADAEWCEGESCYDCSQGDITDDVAIRKYIHWLLEARDENEDLCLKSYYVGVASHYFFDSKDFFHQTKGESERSHSDFEQIVQENMKKSGWYGCAYEVCLNNSDFNKWESEFLSEKDRIFGSSIIRKKGIIIPSRNIFEVFVGRVNYYWFLLRGLFE